MSTIPVSNIVYSILLIVAVISGVFFFYSEIGAGYGFQPDQSEFSEVTNESKEMEQSLKQATDRIAETSDLSLGAQFFTGTIIMFDIMRDVVLSAFGIGASILNFLLGTEFIQMPPWFISLVASIFGAAVVFALAGLVFGRRNA